MITIKEWDKTCNEFLDVLKNEIYQWDCIKILGGGRYKTRP